MKTLLMTNQKGGVGKSAILCQMAHYLDGEGFKVLVLDLDHQKDTTTALTTGDKKFLIPEINSFDVLTKDNLNSFEAGGSVLISGVDSLRKLERNVVEHNQYAINLNNFLNEHRANFDYCLIDTNPSPDIRQIAGMAIADFVLSPIQLNQEAVNGVGGILKQVKSYKAVNPKLKFLGILPNFVERTPFQKSNFSLLKEQYSSILIELGDGEYCGVPRSSSIAEAQAIGIPCNKLKKTQGYTAWRNLTSVFDAILEKMN